MAVIVASVPEFTKRNRSSPVALLMRLPSSTSPGESAPNAVPPAAASPTAATTAGCACPRMSGPYAAT